MTSTSEYSWRSLFQEARIGDIMLFAPKAGCEDGDCFSNSTTNIDVAFGFGINVPYGYYRHSALVYDKDFSTGTLRMMHGRGPENGVGADKESSDYYSYDKLIDSSNGMSGWERIALYRVKETSNLWTNKIMRDTYKKFNNTEYGIIFGTYCSELIEEAYEDYVSLDGDTTYGLFMPDSISDSSQVSILNVWSNPGSDSEKQMKSNTEKINNRLFNLPKDSKTRLDIEKILE